MSLPNIPGAMFIHGGTFIPESRVSVTQEINSTHDARISLIGKHHPMICTSYILLPVKSK